MSVAGFHGRSVELGDDDDKDLGEYQVGNAKFSAQGSAVGLHGSGGIGGRIVGSGHVAGWGFGSQNPHPSASLRASSVATARQGWGTLTSLLLALPASAADLDSQS